MLPPICKASVPARLSKKGAIVSDYRVSWTQSRSRSEACRPLTNRDRDGAQHDATPVAGGSDVSPLKTSDKAPMA